MSLLTIKPIPLQHKKDLPNGRSLGVLVMSYPKMGRSPGSLNSVEADVVLGLTIYLFAY